MATHKRRITTTPERRAASWFLRQIDLRTVIGIMAGIISLVVTGAIFWKESHDQWDKSNKQQDEIQHKADADDVKALKEQVGRQYSTERDDREKEMKAIEEVADWMHYEQGRQAGYKQAMEELKKH